MFPAVAIPNPLHKHRRTGPVLIGFGLAVVLTTFVWSGVPIATAIILIGWGATLVLQAARYRHGGTLSLLNLMVYATLVCLTIAAQVDTATGSPAGSLAAALLVDHLLATVLLLALIRFTCRQALLQP